MVLHTLWLCNIFARIFIPGDTENNEKTRQTAENKQTFDFNVKN